MNVMKTINFFLIILFSTQFQGIIAQNGTSKVLVISGGGARGAWGGGLAQTLVQDSLNDYVSIIGSSTGSLLAPLIALEEFEDLKEAYTTINDKDIFSVRPFKSKGPKRGQIRPFKAFWRILLGKKTLGTSKKLRKTIKKYYTEDHFNRLKDLKKQHISTVVNLTHDTTEYKSSMTYSYESTVNWMWASANAPIFMSLYDAQDEQGRMSTFVDGGVKEGVPLQKGIAVSCDQKLDNVDVIVHNTLEPREDNIQEGGVIKLLTRVIELFLTENRQNDLVAANREAVVIQAFQERCDDEIEFVTITFYFMPDDAYEIVTNELSFDETEMSNMWEAGRTFFQHSKNIRSNVIRVYIPKNQLEDAFRVERFLTTSN